MRGRDDRLLHALHINKLNTHHKKDRRLIILTEKCADLYRPKGSMFSKSVELSRSYLWFDVQQIKSSGPGTVTLIFKGEELTFQHDSVIRVVDAIVRHLRLIFVDLEFPMVLVDGYTIPNPPQDPLRAYYRVRARILSSGMAVPDPLDTALKLFLLSGAQILDLAEIPFGEHFLIVLEALALVPWIKRLLVPAVSEPFWEVAGRFVTGNRYLESFATSQPIDDSFGAFAKSVSEKCPAQFAELGFTGAKIGLKAIADIAQIYTKQAVSSLSISSGVEPQHLPLLFQELGSPKNLRALAFDRVPDFPVKQFFARLEALHRLSLTHCDVDVPLFLKAAGRSRSFTVRELDLSGNDASRGFGTTFVFPASVEKIALNDVVFKRESFAATARFCLTAPALESLSLQNTGLPAAELERAFKNVLARTEGATFALHDFFWDNNSVTPSFLRVLEKCPDLDLLSLNGALTGLDQSIKLLGEYLASDPGIRELRVCGTMQRTLTSWQIAKLLEPLGIYNRTLRAIDLSHNIFDQKALDEVAELAMKNRSLKKIRFQNFGFPDVERFEDFLKKLLARGTPLEIPIPRVDLEEMEKNGGLTKEGLARVIELFSSIALGDPAAVPPPDAAGMAPPVPSYRIVMDGDGAGGAAIDEFVPGPDEWAIVCDPVPPVDNTGLLAEFNEEFAIDALIIKVKTAT
jgi:hypothetical protein